MTVLKDELG